MTENTDNELKVVNVRLVREPSLYSAEPIRNADDAVKLIADELSQYDREVFCVLNLKTNGQVINMNVVSMGTLSSSLVSMREVFKS
ncbi:MAG: JAB domain-containing protein, partial [Anaerovoracaceae bacterium]